MNDTVAAGRPSRINPVLARELRERMRGRRAAITITIWLAANTFILWLVYIASNDDNPFDPFAGTQTAVVGRRLFDWVLFTMLMLVLFIVPAQSAGAIAGERERQTLLPLQITLLSPFQILLGKVLAAVSFLALLIVAAMPMLAVAYLIGGVALFDVARGLGAVLAVGFVLATMCTALSSFGTRVQGATVRAYALTLVLTVGTFVAWGAYGAVDSSRGIDDPDPPEAFLLPNPIVFVADVVDDRDARVTDSPFAGLASILDVDDDDGVAVDDAAVRPVPAPFVPDGGGAVAIERGVIVDVGPVPMEPEGRSSDRSVPFWLGSGGFLVLVSVVLVGVAVRRLRTPAPSER